jgi:DNA-directed RNA polymerase specialized sigma24 family protein
MQRPLERAALSPQRRELVRANIGLVHVHLRSYRTRGSEWTRREWDDFVQEGCLGLIRAAQDFDLAGRIPFAAFALPRIHKAVHRALMERHSAEIGVRSLGIGGVLEPRGRARPGLNDPVEALRDWHGTGPDTVGDRLRGKYDRAVRRALARQMTHQTLKAHQSVLKCLCAERLLIPDPAVRKPYRRIAAEHGVPYARVTQLDRMLRMSVARTLENDPEFAELRRIARAQSDGVDTRPDPALNAHLARVTAAELLQRTLQSPAERRSRIVERLLELAPASLPAAIRRELESLPAEAREELFVIASPVPELPVPQGGAPSKANGADFC